MRIILDARTINDHFPGIGRYTYRLAEALAGALEEGVLLLLHNPVLADSRFDVCLLAHMPQVRLVPTRAGVFSLGAQLRLPVELRRLAGDVQHFPYPVMPYLAPRPRVLTIHDLIPLQMPGYFRARQALSYRLTTWLALRQAARIICVSEATRAEVLARFRLDARRLAVVPEGVDAHFQPCPPDQVRRVRERYRLPERYLLYVGTNKPHKNLPALVDAYARLGQPPPLVLAGGEDSRYPQARRRVEQLGLGEQVIFPGTIAEEDLPALYSGALSFVFVSLYEGFGLPPLEAMACGAPVVCSDIPSLREVTGPAALLVDPSDRGAIAAGLEQIVADEALRADLRARGLARAAEFTWERAARRTLEIYREVMG